LTGRILELHFKELTQIRQTGSTEAFIEEFQRVAVMVPDMTESRLLMMYIEGLTEPLRGWVKAFKPNTLQDAIERTKDLVGAAYKNKVTPRPPVIPRGRETRQVDKGKGKMDEATRRELRRKQLCFTCKEHGSQVTDAWVKEKFII
jgi:outer membrane translocation and assembly module TamA